MDEAKPGETRLEKTWKVITAGVIAALIVKILADA